MNSDLRKCKVGDYVWTIQAGWIKIKSINPKTSWPIETGKEAYTFLGKTFVCNTYPSAFTEPPEGFNPGSKPCQFKKGDRVMVWMVDGSNKFRRYFSHMEDNSFWCFEGGGDEWTSKGTTIWWKYCEAASND